MPLPCLWQDLESCDECEERDGDGANVTTDETSIFLLTREADLGVGGSQKKRQKKETDPLKAQEGGCGVRKRERSDRDPMRGSSQESFLDVISPKRWFDLLLARGGIRAHCSCTQLITLQNRVCAAAACRGPRRRT